MTWSQSNEIIMSILRISVIPVCKYLLRYIIMPIFDRIIHPCFKLVVLTITIFKWLFDPKEWFNCFFIDIFSSKTTHNTYYTYSDSQLINFDLHKVAVITPNGIINLQEIFETCKLSPTEDDDRTLVGERPIWIDRKTPIAIQYHEKERCPNYGYVGKIIIKFTVNYDTKQVKVQLRINPDTVATRTTPIYVFTNDTTVAFQENPQLV